MEFADKQKAEEIIKDLYPDASQVIFVEHGYDNLVVLVDQKYAVRFPRMKSAYLRSQFEKQVLRDLSGLKVIAIPRFLGLGDNPPYSITSFVPGEHMSSAEIRELPTEKQEQIGVMVARFAHEMHSLLSVEEALKLRKQYGLDSQDEEPWDVYFERVLQKQQFPTPEQDKLAKEYYEHWKNLIFTTPTLVIHDDLHNENMQFKDGELVGILDFGDTNIGTPEQELRQLYRINETMLDAAIEEYERLSGLTLNREAIKIWSMTQELAAFSDRYFKDDKSSAAFTRASRNLQKWFPSGNWQRFLPKDKYIKSVQ